MLVQGQKKGEYLEVQFSGPATTVNVNPGSSNQLDLTTSTNISGYQLCGITEFYPGNTGLAIMATSKLSLGTPKLTVTNPTSGTISISANAAFIKAIYTK